MNLHPSNSRSFMVKGEVAELLRPGFRLTLLSRNHGGFYMVGRGPRLPGPGVRVGGAANIAMVLLHNKKTR